MNTIAIEAIIEDKQIIDFIQMQTVMTMSVNNHELQPYCASCFYVFDSTNALIIFKSEAATSHIEFGLQHNAVGGSILPDKLVKQHIQGIQFTGTLLPHGNEYLLEAKKMYYFKYPFAAVMAGQIWIIKIDYIKFTDNSLGFGKKIIWKRQTT